MAHVCPWWLAYTFDNRLRALFHKPKDIFAGIVKEGQVVADIGCGMGYFAIALAHIVKPHGKVYAIDIQKEMLSTLKKRALKAGVSDNIVPLLSNPGEIALQEPIDFALAFWMLHETQDQHIFIQEIFEGLKKGGLFLVTEPKLHVSRKKMEQEIALATEIGLAVEDRPEIALSHSTLLRKPLRAERT